MTPQMETYSLVEPSMIHSKAMVTIDQDNEKSTVKRVNPPTEIGSKGNQKFVSKGGLILEYQPTSKPTR